MRIEHLALNVDDPIGMAQWYVAHLGLTVVREFGPPGFGRFLADEGGRTLLEFYVDRDAPIPDYAALHPRTLHLAFWSSDLAELTRQLVAAGAKLIDAPRRTSSGDEFAMLRDPWGLPLQLVWRQSPLA